jgi:hypothetical protein
VRLVIRGRMFTTLRVISFVSIGLDTISNCALRVLQRLAVARILRGFSTHIFLLASNIWKASHAAQAPPSFGRLEADMTAHSRNVISDHR